MNNWIMNLLAKKCVPCEVKIPPMSSKEAQKHLSCLSLEWLSENNKKILREFIFKNFKEAISFVNSVADLSEREGHHPDIFIFYNKVKIELWTHFIGGLSKNDFILAAKIEDIFKNNNTKK